MINTKEEYRSAVEALNKAAYAYYTLDNPIMSDAAYDVLYFQLKDWEDKNLKDIDPTSPTQRVGDRILSGFEKASHGVKMYSLDDVFDPEEFLSWANKVKAEYPNAIFYQEPKYDGLSLNLQYDNGSLIKAITRGDGEIGEDVTENAHHIKGIPLNIDFKGFIEIRGEVVLFNEDFAAVNEDRIKSGKNEFLNERNAASGILRSFDSIQVKNGRLRFTPYSIGKHEEISFHSQRQEYEFFMNQGFINWNKLLDLYIASNDPEDLVEDYNSIIENRKTAFPMLLDGMVIKVDQKSIQQDLGFTNKFPKWAIAFKFPAEEQKTKLNDVIFQVGKTGAITPVGIVAPVNFEGVTVRRVTLHNFDEINRLDLRIGDTVGIIRSGDVIPKITGVYISERKGNEVIVNESSECPVCGSLTERKNIKGVGEESSVLYCSNHNCPAVLKGRLEYAVGKKALDIPGFGEAVVNELIDRGLVTKLSDIYSLTTENLLSLEGFAIRKAQLIVASINESKGYSDHAAHRGALEAHRLLNALDIPTIGERASKKLVIAFGERIFSGELTFEDLISVEDIGETSANNFIFFFSKKVNQIEVDTLVDLINLKYPEVIEISEDSLIANKTFVITGTLSESRDHFKQLVESNGGKVSGSVSKKTDYLLAGDKAGSKLDKAVKLGVTVLSESDFNNLI